MKIFRGWEQVGGLRVPSVAVGSFDGVHLGHRAIIENLLESAAASGGDSVIVTFGCHPREVLYGRASVKGILTTGREKLMLFESLGISAVVIAPFSSSFGSLSAEDFVREYLIGILRMKTFVMGYDNHFGRGRAGDYKMMTELGVQDGFNVSRVGERIVSSSSLSSTTIREYVTGGEMRKASELLGYDYFIAGDADGFSRAFKYGDGKLLPPEGLYHVRIELAKVFTGKLPGRLLGGGRYFTEPNSTVRISAGGDIIPGELPENAGGGADLVISFF